MKTPLNSPIIKKDLKVISRSMKFSWGLFAYMIALSITFFLTMSVSSISYSYGMIKSKTDLYSGYISFFPVVGIVQLIIIALIVPIITASAISGERERKTMDVLLTTTITEPQIIYGKIGSAVVRVMIFVVVSVPLMSVSFIVGGLSWLALFEYILLAFIFACVTGSVGILCSSICKKSITSIILSYVIYLGIYGLPFILWLVEYLMNTSRSTYYMAPLALLMDPVFTFIAFFIKKLTGENSLDIFGHKSGLFSWTDNLTVWVILSSVVQIAMGVIFALLAARNIRPGKKDINNG